MKAKIYFLTALFCLPFIAYSQHSSLNTTVIACSPEEEIVVAVPASEPTVIKFEGDSVIFQNGSWRLAFDRAEITSFRHDAVLLSDFDVLVSAEENTEISEKDFVVMLFHREDEDISGFIQKADSSGMAHFDYIPTGFYSVYLYSADYSTLMGAFEDVYHGYDDQFVALVSETAAVAGINLKENAAFIDLVGRYLKTSPSQGVYIKKTANGYKKIIR